MTLNQVVNKGAFIKRSNWTNFGKIIDTGTTLLFVYPVTNMSQSTRLTLDDVIANDWEMSY